MDIMLIVIQVFMGISIFGGLLLFILITWNTWGDM